MTEGGLAATLGDNLRFLRRRLGLSVEGLAIRSGVSRSTISDVERAAKTPSVNVVHRLARALGVEFGALVEGRRSHVELVRAEARRVWTARDPGVVIAALFPPGRELQARLYQLRLAARACHVAAPHAEGTSCHLVVGQGTVAVDLDGEHHLIPARDALVYAGDQPQRYANASDEPAELYVMVSGGRLPHDGRHDWGEAQSPG